MCGRCKYLEYPNSNDHSNPCNTCIVWGEDGYKNFRNYEWDGKSSLFDDEEWKEMHTEIC
jgi:hypothetical protein